jgi:hypothetical protein
MHFFAESALGSDAHAVADHEHANYEFGIDGLPTGMAVKRRQMLAQISQIEEAVHASQQVIVRAVIFEIEGVEQLILNDALTHHDAYLHR